MRILKDLIIFQYNGYLLIFKGQHTLQKISDFHLLSKAKNKEK